MRILLPLLLAAMVLLTVCASSGRDGADQTASAPADGLVIRLDELTDEISFVDYMSGSTASRFICPRGWAGSWPGWGRLRGRVRPRWKRQIKPTPRDRASAPDRFRRRAAGLTSSDLAALGHLPQRGRLGRVVRPRTKRPPARIQPSAQKKPLPGSAPGSGFCHAGIRRAPCRCRTRCER